MYLCNRRIQIAIRPIAKERVNVKFVIHPLIILEIVYFIIYFPFAQTNVVKLVFTACCVCSDNKVIVLRVRLHKLGRLERESRPISIERKFYYARFALKFFHPFLGFYFGKNKEVVQIFFFVKVNDFVCINRFRNSFEQYGDFYSFRRYVIRTVFRRNNHFVSTCAVRRKFTISNRYFRLFVAVYKIQLNFRRDCARNVRCGYRRQRIFFTNVTCFCSANFNSRRNRVLNRHGNRSRFRLPIRQNNRTSYDVAAQFGCGKIILIDCNAFTVGSYYTVSNGVIFIITIRRYVGKGVNVTELY